MALVVGICGGSGSGKTTVAKAIAEAIPNKCVIIAQDSYYKDNRHLPLPERAKLNYDHPDAFDHELLINHLQLLIQGRPIQQPIYDYSQHTRSDKTLLVSPAEVILLEGILIFNDERLRSLLDLKIFVDTDADIRLIRRVMRDVNERNRSLESVIMQYQTSVKPMHEAFIEPSKRYADIILPEGGHNLTGLDVIISKVKLALSENHPQSKTRCKTGLSRENEPIE